MSHVPPSDPANPYANPYAVTTSQLGQQLGTDAEAIRKQYLSHEASVKSIGTLYMLGACFGILATVIYLVIAVATLVSGEPNAGSLAVFIFAMACLFGTLSTAQLFAAIGLWKLKPWARIVATVLSVIGLLGIPIGTLISAYFLYLLQSQKGTVVFSDQYKQIIAQTPHIKYRTSIVVWIFLGLLVLLIVLGIVAALVGGAR